MKEKTITVYEGVNGVGKSTYLADKDPDVFLKREFPQFKSKDKKMYGNWKINRFLFEFDSFLETYRKQDKPAIVSRWIISTIVYNDLKDLTIITKYLKEVDYIYHLQDKYNKNPELSSRYREVFMKLEERGLIKQKRNRGYIFNAYWTLYEVVK